MPSLFAHEHLVHEYAEKSDYELTAFALELHELRDNTEIPRQLDVIDKLLGHLAFEVSYRMGLYGAQGTTADAGTTAAE